MTMKKKNQGVLFECSFIVVVVVLPSPNLILMKHLVKRFCNG